MNKLYIAYDKQSSTTSDGFVASMNNFAKKSKFSEVVHDKDLLDNDPMGNEITRNEFNAEIKAIEANIDRQVAEIRGDFKAYMAEGRERDKRIELLVANAERNSQIASEAARDAAGLKSEARTAMLTIILSVFAIAAGSVLAIKASNEAIVQTVTSVYQQGQSSSPPGKNHK